MILYNSINVAYFQIVICLQTKVDADSAANGSFFCENVATLFQILPRFATCQTLLLVPAGWRPAGKPAGKGKGAAASAPAHSPAAADGASPATAADGASPANGAAPAVPLVSFFLSFSDEIVVI